MANWIKRKSYKTGINSRATLTQSAGRSATVSTSSGNPSCRITSTSLPTGQHRITTSYRQCGLYRRETVTDGFNSKSGRVVARNKKNAPESFYGALIIILFFGICALFGK
jgi:hypothetical protein